MKSYFILDSHESHLRHTKATIAILTHILPVPVINITHLVPVRFSLILPATQAPVQLSV